MMHLQAIMINACNVGFYEDQGTCYKCADGWKSWDSSDPNTWNGKITVNIVF